MLSILFGSATRAKMLELLILQPDRRFRLRELVREVGKSWKDFWEMLRWNLA